MVGWIALVVGVVVMLALVWWSAKGPDDGPGGEKAREFRERGGWGGL